MAEAVLVSGAEVGGGNGSGDGDEVGDCDKGGD